MANMIATQDQFNLVKAVLRQVTEVNKLHKKKHKQPLQFTHSARVCLNATKALDAKWKKIERSDKYASTAKLSGLR